MSEDLQCDVVWDSQYFSRFSNGHSASSRRPSRSQHPPVEDHEFDSACRTIHQADKEALMAIQGATDDILKVIRDMSIESRPPGPVSAFIKIPKQVDVDETGRPTESFKNATRSQLNNKEGFTISYDDKRSLEMIRTAAREIQTQLLHLDLPERHVMPRGQRIPSQFRLAVSAIGNEYFCCKQDFSIPPITELKNKSSLPTVKVSIDWVIGGIKTVCL